MARSAPQRDHSAALAEERNLLGVHSCSRLYGHWIPRRSAEFGFRSISPSRPKSSRSASPSVFGACRRGRRPMPFMTTALFVVVVLVWQDALRLGWSPAVVGSITRLEITLEMTGVVSE